MFDCKSFELSDSQIEKIKKWDKTHECSLKPKYGMKKYAGAIGGHLSITFTPTSVGNFVGVRCSCGSEIDISEL